MEWEKRLFTADYSNYSYHEIEQLQDSKNCTLLDTIHGMIMEKKQKEIKITQEDSIL